MSSFLLSGTGGLKLKSKTSKYQTDLAIAAVLAPPGTPWAWYKNGTGIYADTGGGTPATNGSAVSLWNDSSGNTRHASLGVIGQTLEYETNVVNNLPVVRYLGGGTPTHARFLKSSSESLSLTNVTLAVIWKCYASFSGAYEMPLAIGDPAAAGNSAGFNIRLSSPLRTTRSFEKGVEAAYTGAIDTTNFYALVGTYDGTNLRFYANNVLKATSANTTQSLIATTGVGLFRPPGANYQAFGYMAEAIIYNSLLDSTNLGLLQTYFTAKFGAFTDAF